jgi:hypothetical protein
MKSIFTFLFLFLFAFASYSQTDTTAIPLVAYWSKGDSYQFKITKVQKQWKAEKLTKNDSSSYLVNFQVVEANKSSYKIKWIYTNNLTKDYNIPEKLVSRLSKYKVTEVIYKTSETGVFQGIENWKEIGKMMKDLFSELIKLSEEEGKIADKEKFKSSMQSLEAVYSSKEGLEQLVFKELPFFHFAFGYQFARNIPLLYEEQLPNMFGGAPIRGDTKVYVNSVKEENETFVLMKEMKLNPDDTKQMLTDLFKKMHVPAADLKKMMDNAQVDVTDSNRYEYNYGVGLPVHIETFRKSLIDIDNEKGIRIDRISIELVQD